MISDGGLEEDESMDLSTPNNGENGHNKNYTCAHVNLSIGFKTFHFHRLVGRPLPRIPATSFLVILKFSISSVQNFRMAIKIGKGQNQITSEAGSFERKDNSLSSLLKKKELIQIR